MRGQRPRWTLLALVLAACAEQPLAGRPDWTLAQHEANRRCQEGSVEACSALGRSLLAGDENPGARLHSQNGERALVLLEIACGQGDVPACTVLGRAYGMLFDDERAAARATGLLTRGCDGRSGSACTGLGYLALSKDRARAAERFRAGCELGDAEGCELYGQLALLSPRLGNEQTAEAAFARGCALGLATACRRLTSLWVRDPARRAEGLRRLADGCGHGQAASCVELALLSAPLLSPHPDCPQAVTSARAACQGGAPEGCAVAAACRLNDAPSRPEAIAELRSRCDHDEPLACLYWADAAAETATPDQLKAAYQAGCRRGSPAAPVACPRLTIQELAEATLSYEAERRLEELRQFCSRSLGEACCALAGQYATGKWMAADAAKVTELRARACELGQSACCPASPSAPSH
jgi:TPR repeat protein